jgi:hypothetical protein
MKVTCSAFSIQLSLYDGWVGNGVMFLLELVRGQAVQAAVWTHGVVVAPPGIGEDDGLAASQALQRQAFRLPGIRPEFTYF